MKNLLSLSFCTPIFNNLSWKGGKIESSVSLIRMLALLRSLGIEYFGPLCKLSNKANETIVFKSRQEIFLSALVGAQVTQISTFFTASHMLPMYNHDSYWVHIHHSSSTTLFYILFWVLKALQRGEQKLAFNFHWMVLVGIPNLDMGH